MTSLFIAAYSRATEYRILSVEVIHLSTLLLNILYTIKVAEKTGIIDMHYVGTTCLYKRFYNFIIVKNVFIY